MGDGNRRNEAVDRGRCDPPAAGAPKESRGGFVICARRIQERERPKARRNGGGGLVVSECREDLLEDHAREGDRLTPFDEAREAPHRPMIRRPTLAERQ